MRTIINISLPEQLRIYMLKRSKESGYSSLSEYVRDLVRNDQRDYLTKLDEKIDRRRLYHASIHGRRS